MAQITTKTTAELSTDINVITAEINAYQRVAGEAIFEIGRRLKHVKENDLAHGEWAKWLDDVGMSRAQAHKFITVFERFGDVSPVKQLPSVMSVLYELTSFTDEELTQPHAMPDGSTKTLPEMSRREIEELKRQLRVERQAREMEREGAERLKAELAKARTEPPRVEVRTEYIRDESAEDELRRYRERFGDIEIYESTTMRLATETEVEGLVLGFSEDVRDFIKKYAFLEHYAEEFTVLSDLARKEYIRSLEAIGNFSYKLSQTAKGRSNGNIVIIDAN